MESQKIIRPPVSNVLKSERITLMPGESVGEHVSHQREELIIVMNGIASIYELPNMNKVDIRENVFDQDEIEEVDMNAKKLTKVKAGETHYIAPDVLHDVKNEGRDYLEYIYVVTSVNPKE